ncbi:MAG: hypothetical protein WD576_00110 [Nitriliruptoraceae bacterium]
MRNKREQAPLIGVNLIADPYAAIGPRHARRRRSHKRRARLRAVTRDNPLDYADVPAATSRASVPPPPTGQAGSLNSADAPVARRPSPQPQRSARPQQPNRRAGSDDPAVMFAAQTPAADAPPAKIAFDDDADRHERASARKRSPANRADRLSPVASLTPKRRRFGLRKTVVVLVLVTTAVGLVAGVITYYAAPDLFDAVWGRVVELAEALVARFRERGIVVWPR